MASASYLPLSSQTAGSRLCWGRTWSGRLTSQGLGPEECVEKSRLETEVQGAGRGPQLQSGLEGSVLPPPGPQSEPRAWKQLRSDGPTACREGESLKPHFSGLLDQQQDLGKSKGFPEILWLGLLSGGPVFISFLSGGGNGGVRLSQQAPEDP